jgi:hypothetical protein
MKIITVQTLKHPRSRLVFVLSVIAIHSLLIGIGLIARPAMLMRFFGFGPCFERFFPTQGGVFHIAMAVGYAMAAVNVDKFRCLIYFSIIVKTLATIYLFIYYSVLNSLWIILASGVGDGIMALAIFLSLLFYVRSGENAYGKAEGLQGGLRNGRNRSNPLEEAGSG